MVAKKNDPAILGGVMDCFIIMKTFSGYVSKMVQQINLTKLAG